MTVEKTGIKGLIEESLEEGRRDGAREERVRVASIMLSRAAEGRERLARYLALETEISADDAVRQLATSPLDPPESGRNRLN